MDERLNRLQDLWTRESQGLKQPYQNQMLGGMADPMSAIMQLQQGYGRQLDPGVLLRFLQQGQGMQQYQGQGGGDPFMALIQALLSGGQMQGRR